MSHAPTITKGQQIIELLEAYGVDTVFGIPGVHTLELYRGLAASNIQHITPRNEQGAGFMADGYARITAKPGVCFVWEILGGESNGGQRGLVALGVTCRTRLKVGAGLPAKGSTRFG